MSARFIFKAIPDLRAQIVFYEEIVEELFSPFNNINKLVNIDSIDRVFNQDSDTKKPSKQYSVLERYFFANKRYLQALYTLFPMVDSKCFLGFMICFNMLNQYLEHLCNFKQINNESILRELYLSMLEAVDPDLETSDHFGFYNEYFPKKSIECVNLEDNYLNYFVDSCRTQLKEIPCYAKVKEYIKKYVYIKVEYYVFKHVNENSISNSIDQFDWTRPFLKYYPGIKPWEFQSIACSDFGILALLALSFNPYLSQDTIDSVDKLYFPWINGLQSLLAGYVNLYQDMFSQDTPYNGAFLDNYNCSDSYDNLKQCEERLIVFLENSLDSCKNTLDPRLNNIHIALIKLILVVYLSDPRAHFGLKEIATKNLLATAHRYDISFWKSFMSLILPAEYHCAYPN